MRKKRNINIQGKFIICFLFISLVPLAISILVSFNSFFSILEEEAVNRLNVVADSKANQIESYFRNRRLSISQIALMSDITEAVSKYSEVYRTRGINSDQYKALDDSYRPILTYYKKNFDCDNLFLVSKTGEIVFSVNDSDNHQSLYEQAVHGKSELANAFISVMKTHRTEISRFSYDWVSDRAIVYIVAPIINGPEFAGAVIARIDDRVFEPFVKDYRGLGQSGETLLGTLVNNEALYINDFRFPGYNAVKKTVSMGEKDNIDIQNAVQGKEGKGLSVDYRGMKVLTLWRSLPLSGLGMVIKIDTSEVFASGNRLKNVLIAISFVLLVMVVTMAVLISRSISNPIKKLTLTAVRISEGNLNERASVIADDEISTLASSFNQMADRLIEAKNKVEEEREKIKEQKKMLEKVNHELDSFVYTASHDLRAPLRGVSSFASFLIEDSLDKLDDEGKTYLEGIRRGANRMSKLIDDLLTLSRMSRINNPYEQVNMNEIVSSVLERIEFDIKDYNVDIIFERNLPVVNCDKIKISEVFLNLINNAIKFSSKNNPDRPRVEIGYNDMKGYFDFFIKDNGIGIEPKYHKQIFGIFKRLHSEKEYDGTGAGLSIVKRIIEDHGGDIWVDSEYGKGSVFHFSLPKNV
ncbi:MAG: ATP-binding protein [Candidatus Omnitrophica bacterium]|nr:ATP-binding protein [Candidatus Omnitrophota bacterium]